MSDHELTQAELFDIFSNARRRQTVQFLNQRGGSCELASLVEQVAAWENDADPDEVTRTQRRRVYISLYQTHLPMLEDHGIVDWDPDAHAIELLPSAEIFEPYLDRRLENGRNWHRVYLPVVTTGAVVTITAWLAPITTVAVSAVAMALCLIVFGISIVQRISRRADFDGPATRVSH